MMASIAFIIKVRVLTLNKDRSCRPHTMTILYQAHRGHAPPYGPVKHSKWRALTPVTLCWKTESYSSASARWLSRATRDGMSSVPAGNCSGVLERSPYALVP